jgi:ElaA protein
MSLTKYTVFVKAFAELSPYELYAIMRLRNEVFVLEQQCIYQDADNKDPHCHHLMIYDKDFLVAYARILPPGLAYEKMSIGKTGAGKLLLEKSIEACRTLFGEGPIKIGAQLYLQKFYESFGFVQTSDVYDEDEIEHIEMVLD